MHLALARGLVVHQLLGEFHQPLGGEFHKPLGGKGKREPGMDKQRKKEVRKGKHKGKLLFFGAPGAPLGTPAKGLRSLLGSWALLGPPARPRLEGF